MHAAPDPEEFVHVMAPAVRRAGEVARSLEGRVANQPKRGEATAVKQALTEADKASQEVILQVLLANWPDVALAAEEDTPSARHFTARSDALVIVDPIDGTLHSYLRGDGPYAVIVGLAIGGKMRAGLVAIPREELIFGAALGTGASVWDRDAEARSIQVERGGSRVLVSHQMPDAVVEALGARDLEVQRACGGAIAVAPLVPDVRAGLRWTDHECGVSIRGRVGVLISREAGAQVQTDGARLLSLRLDEVVSTLRVGNSEADLAMLDGCLAAGGLA